MTTIIAIEHKDGVTVGYDAQGTTGAHSYQLDTEKVFANGEVIFGCSGSLRDSNVLRHADIPAPKPQDWDTDRWVSRNLVPAMRKALGGDEREGRFLVIVRGRVYEIEPDLGWSRRADGIYTIGSGADFALGALTANVTVREALEIASKHDAYTGGTLRVRQAAEFTEGAIAA